MKLANYLKIELYESGYNEHINIEFTFDFLIQFSKLERDDIFLMYFYGYITKEVLNQFCELYLIDSTDEQINQLLDIIDEEHMTKDIFVHMCQNLDKLNFLTSRDININKSKLIGLCLIEIYNRNLNNDSAIETIDWLYNNFYDYHDSLESLVWYRKTKDFSKYKLDFYKDYRKCMKIIIDEYYRDLLY